MKEFNCPDCQRTDSCNGCPRTIKYTTTTNTITDYGRKLLEDYPKLNVFPDVCKNCSNNPRNGGSGICFCTLGIQTIC